MADPKNEQTTAAPSGAPIEQPKDVIPASEDEALEVDSLDDGGSSEVGTLPPVASIPEPVRVVRPAPPKKKRMVAPNAKPARLEVLRAVCLHEGKILTEGYECDVAKELEKLDAVARHVGMIVEPGHLIEVPEHVAEDLCQPYAGPYAYFGQRREEVKRYQIVRCRRYVARAKRRA